MGVLIPGATRAVSMWWSNQSCTYRVSGYAVGMDRPVNMLPETYVDYVERRADGSLVGFLPMPEPCEHGRVPTIPVGEWAA